MDSDDEEMRDASSSSVGDDDGDGGAVFEEEEEGDGKDGVMVMEVRWFEVDLDYEYDAPRWFDLAQEEAPVEAAAAELWFATAPSYPPSRRIPCYGASKNERKPVTQSAVKGSLSKGSTLMKPTASQLARQHKQLEVKNAVPYVDSLC